MKKNLICLLAMLLVFSLAVTGCGAEKAKETTSPAAADPSETAAALGLESWKLTASTWSSPNGATVHLSATPYSYVDGDTASFIVRLEGEDVDTIPCQWDGKNYTASAELNASDGYCYYVLQSSADGNSAEIPVNTPNALVDDSLINLETALQSYCTLTVNASQQDGGKLTITDGTIKVQLPMISNEGETILCESAVLVLTFEGKEVSSALIGVGDPADGGVYDLSIAGTTFDVPNMEDDQRLELRLDVTLSNDQTLTAMGGSWLYNDGKLLLAAG